MIWLTENQGTKSTADSSPMKGNAVVPPQTTHLFSGRQMQFLKLLYDDFKAFI